MPEPDAAYDPYDHLPPPELAHPSVSPGRRRSPRLRSLLAVGLLVALALVLLAAALKPGP